MAIVVRLSYIVLINYEPLLSQKFDISRRSEFHQRVYELGSLPAYDPVIFLHALCYMLQDLLTLLRALCMSV
ncbi:hypothetical protein GJV44_00223 [Candidatus Vallotia cooleyia]|nr:hypothetical protein GJV44_00223 [Candidatus Vallotia cooleyia]